MEIQVNSPEIKSFGAENDPKILKYLGEQFRPEDEAGAEIRARAQSMDVPPIHVGAFDGRHIQVLARAVQAKKIIEIGTLAGYSALCLSRILPKDGVIHTFEYSEAHSKVALETFKKYGVSDRVHLHFGEALKKLKNVEALGPFDFVFIDADKENYPHYFDWAAKNIRSGGMIVADNTLAWGMIADENFENDEDRAAVMGLREFNRKAATHPDFISTMLPTGEGLTVAVKK